VIDSVNLPLVQHLADASIESARRFQIVTEGFFDDNATPVAFLSRQTGLTELGDDRTEQLRRGCQVVEYVAARVVLLVDRHDLLGQVAVRGGVPSIECDVVKALDQPLHD
jgi:hypothetical protein